MKVAWVYKKCKFSPRQEVKLDLFIFIPSAADKQTDWTGLNDSELLQSSTSFSNSVFLLSVSHWSWHTVISPLSLTLSVQYKTCKDGSVLGVTVMRIAMLTHCQALTQSCSYTEGNTRFTLRLLQFDPQTETSRIYNDVLFLSSCSRDHSECIRLQEGSGTVARHPDCKTNTHLML